MLKGKLRKHKFSLIVILIIAVTFTAAFGTISSRAESVGRDPIKNINEDRSQVFMYGKNYSLDDKQEKQHEDEQERKAKQIKKEQNKENQVEQRLNQNSKNSNSGKNTASDKGKADASGEGQGNSSGNGEEQRPGNDKDDNDLPESGDEQEISKTPVIITSLTDGQHVDGLRVVFTVQGKTYLGYKIESFNFDVKVNGVKVYSSGVDTYKRTYRAELNDGANEVEITIKDDDGNSVTNYYKVYADKDGQVKEGGSATVSLNTRTIGLGVKFTYTATFYDGDNVPDVVIRALENNGYGYDAKKTPGVGWYLARVKKSGITSGFKIPDPIQEKLDEMGATKMEHESNSLGEGDFYKNSGWMWRLNNEILNSGMSNLDVEDGDEIELFFTLNLGYEYNGGWFNGSW